MFSTSEKLTVKKRWGFKKQLLGYISTGFQAPYYVILIFCINSYLHIIWKFQGLSTNSLLLIRRCTKEGKQENSLVSGNAI